MRRMPLWAVHMLFAACAMLAIAAGAAAAETAISKAAPALWRVQHGTSTVYLLGSLHILPRDFSWRTPQIEAAIAASDRFYFEVPVDKDALKAQKEFVIQNGILANRQTLRGLLSPAEFQRYSAVLRRTGIKAMFYERYRPWLASVMVGLAYLHTRDLTTLKGADDDVMAYAREHDRPLLYLESIQDQMKLLTAGSDESQLRALKALIQSLPGSREQETVLRQVWASGNAKAMNAILDSYFRGHPEAQELLIDRRNHYWLPVLNDVLAQESSTTMITVGVAHIGGRAGLLALLCGEGYKVERAGTDENACGPET